ncbi:hypothetical protein [Nocardioides stalactiti]|uniref:hypothetical protein n=1 Tax=Nocardioides stalactiti TaxID=2755356 RepID=UPI00160325A4|nr:hypothetical protein [Nocardioides stalactiti]
MRNTALVAALAAAGTLTATVGVVAVMRTASSDDSSPAGAPALATVASCRSLLDAGWTAPPGDPSFEVDPTTWQVTVTLGNGSELQLDLDDDPSCAALPDIGGPLSRMIGNYERIRAEECADEVAAIRAGQVPSKGPATGTIDAMRDHVLAWCPSSFADQLPPG